MCCSHDAGTVPDVRSGGRCGYRQGVIGLLGTRRWTGGLLFAVAFAVVCCFLGRWQWDASQAPHGDLQNFAYAFNWWIFAVVGLGYKQAPTKGKNVERQ